MTSQTLPPPTFRVFLLDKKELIFELESRNVRLNDLFLQTCISLGLKEPHFFGLALLKDSEFYFYPLETKLSKLFPKIRNKLPHEDSPILLNFYLRVLHYVSDVNIFKDSLTLKLYCLQLRDNFIRYQLFLPEEKCFLLASYSMMIDYGPHKQDNYTPSSQNIIFEPKEHLPLSIICKYGVDYILKNLPQMYKSVSKETEPYMGLINELNNKPFHHNFHVYRLSPSQSEDSILINLTLGPQGITILNKEKDFWLSSKSIPWRDLKIACDKRKVELSSKPYNRMVYYAKSKQWSRHFFELCKVIQFFQEELKDSLKTSSSLIEPLCLNGLCDQKQSRGENKKIQDQLTSGKGTLQKLVNHFVNKPQPLPFENYKQKLISEEMFSNSNELLPKVSNIGNNKFNSPYDYRVRRSSDSWFKILTNIQLDESDDLIVSPPKNNFSNIFYKENITKNNNFDLTSENIFSPFPYKNKVDNVDPNSKQADIFLDSSSHHSSKAHIFSDTETFLLSQKRIKDKKKKNVTEKKKSINFDDNSNMTTEMNNLTNVSPLSLTSSPFSREDFFKDEKTPLSNFERPLSSINEQQLKSTPLISALIRSYKQQLSPYRASCNGRLTQTSQKGMLSNFRPPIHSSEDLNKINNSFKLSKKQLRNFSGDKKINNRTIIKTNSVENKNFCENKKLFRSPSREGGEKDVSLMRLSQRRSSGFLDAAYLGRMLSSNMSFNQYISYINNSSPKFCESEDQIINKNSDLNHISQKNILPLPVAFNQKKQMETQFKQKNPQITRSGSLVLTRHSPISLIRTSSFNQKKSQNNNFSLYDTKFRKKNETCSALSSKIPYRPPPSYEAHCQQRRCQFRKLSIHLKQQSFISDKNSCIIPSPSDSETEKNIMTEEVSIILPTAPQNSLDFLVTSH